MRIYGRLLGALCMMVSLWGGQRAFCAPFVVYDVEVGKYMGECNQREGVIQAIQKPFPDVEVHSILLAGDTPSAQEKEGLLKSILATAETGEKSVVLSGHRYGAEVFKFLHAELPPETRQHVTLCLTGLFYLAPLVGEVAATRRVRGTSCIIAKRKTGEVRSKRSEKVKNSFTSPLVG